MSFDVLQPCRSYAPPDADRSGSESQPISGAQGLGTVVDVVTPHLFRHWFFMALALAVPALVLIKGKHPPGGELLVILAVCLGAAFPTVYFLSCRIYLCRTGMLIKSLFGKKALAYDDLAAIHGTTTYKLLLGIIPIWRTYEAQLITRNGKPLSANSWIYRRLERKLERLVRHLSPPLAG